MLTGMVQIAQGQSERALASLRTAVDANPSLAQAQGLYGQILAIRGHAEDSVRHTQLAMRLSPRDPRPGKFHSGLAMAHFVAQYGATSGEVERPGTVQAMGTQRLHELILVAGGITPRGSVRHVRLTRGASTHEVDLLRFELGGDLEQNP